jgi:aminopeptidase N
VWLEGSPIDVRRILTAFAAAAVLAFAGPAGQAAAAPAPGAAGIGDSYFPDYGNGGYDVAHYDIHLRYFPDTDTLTGTTTILATATQDLSSFDLDFVLKVSSIQVNNRAATFVRSGDHELIVTPARPIASGADMTVVVTYSDVPSTHVAAGFTAWTRTADGALAVGEPEIAWWWFPSNDHPLDKATYDVGILVPDSVQVIANGVQPSAPVAELQGWHRWYWRQTSPAATYLESLVIGKYDINTDVSEDGTPIVTAYSTSLGANDGAARSSVERTNEILNWESTIFGPYPFTARGGVVVPSNSLGFALESESRPVFDGAFWRRGANTSVVVHENAHQWFGDSVSVADWKHIWLNEAFATYAEWLWSEKNGDGTAQEIATSMYNSIAPDNAFWQILPADPTPAHEFNNAVYDRGGMGLQALRNAVGDDTFFLILKTWATTHKFGNGTTDQFIALSNAISGKNLSAVFNTWLFTKGKPAAPPIPQVTGSFVPRSVAAAAAVARARAQRPPRSWNEIKAADALVRAGKG